MPPTDRVRSQNNAFGNRTVVAVLNVQVTHQNGVASAQYATRIPIIQQTKDIHAHVFIRSKNADG